MKLERGMLVSNTDLNWYVVAEIHYKNDTVYLNCICDNANNVYRFNINEIKYFLNVNEFESNIIEMPKELKERGIPYSVVLDALGGQFEGRFWED